MALAFTANHAHAPIKSEREQASTGTKSTRRGYIAQFFCDLIEDVRQKPLQAAAFAKHDMFREHINAMSISYFVLILVLIAASLPVLLYAVQFLVQY